MERGVQHAGRVAEPAEPVGRTEQVSRLSNEWMEEGMRENGVERVRRADRAVQTAQVR